MWRGGPERRGLLLGRGRRRPLGLEAAQLSGRAVRVDLERPLRVPLLLDRPPALLCAFVALMSGSVASRTARMPRHS